MKNGLCFIALLFVFACKAPTTENTSKQPESKVNNVNNEEISKTEEEDYFLKPINDSIITEKKAYNIEFIENLEKFVYESRLRPLTEQLDENDNLVVGEDFYILGEYNRYYYVIAYTNPVVGIKDNSSYRVWKLPATLPEFSYVFNRGFVEINGKKLLHLEGCYETRWSMASLNPGSFNEYHKTLLLINLTENTVVFHKTFSCYAERVKDIKTLETDENPEYESQWYNCNYSFTPKGIEFYKLSSPSKECNQENDAFVTAQKRPDFYYQYIPENKKWVKKIPTH
ncbi:hypothetical protein QQ054_23580 [Oscillatoria amoena NRMC-F 0135]|nr:hypothetical protein [Oscillatoria amoena NRMC-F 0135]